MVDRPIIFSAPMVRALLDGRKTQTRRVLKVPMTHRIDDEGIIWAWTDWGEDMMPYPYAHGDRLWVREAWHTSKAYDDLPPRDMGGEEPILYVADDRLRTNGWSSADWREGRYRHARFMPRWASRRTLIVTDVRVQRLQDISEADAVAEGIEGDPVNAWRCYQPEPKGQTHWACPRESFRTLWNSLRGPDAWDANPWVCALSFTVHRGNIDQMGGA